jgi:phosphoribosyl-ATP pyrophosphohydrolase
MGEELQEILQNSSNEEYTENKHSEGSNVEIDKEADETEETVIQGKDNDRKNRNLQLLHV